MQLSLHGIIFHCHGGIYFLICCQHYFYFFENKNNIENILVIINIDFKIFRILPFQNQDERIFFSLDRMTHST